jgi:formamidopyrimidine-DNA glycosylase
MSKIDLVGMAASSLPTCGRRYHDSMPELPEVETIRRDLERRIVGRRITAVRIPPDSGKPVPVLKGIDEASFREGVVGARVEAVERRGKYLAVRLDTGSLIVVHLRMTGSLLHRAPNAEPDRFLRAVLVLDDGSELRFTDIRKFGGLWLVDDVSEAVATGLGPEPLSEGFTAAVLAAALKGRKTPVKSVLLDQSRIAGIGNIYADEACFAAGVDPRRLAGSIKKPQVVRLHKAIQDVLLFGVESRGASFRDYQDVEGESGSMQMHVKVFRRTGKPCYECGATIERVRLGGRSTHFCPKCQR